MAREMLWDRPDLCDVALACWTSTGGENEQFREAIMQRVFDRNATAGDLAGLTAAYRTREAV